MKLPIPVSWPRRIPEARRVQEQLRAKVVTRNCFGKIHTVAGIDVGFEKNGTVTRAAVVVLDFPSLTLIEQAVARRPTRFPYVPGYLSFREAPAALAALKKLQTRPDLVLYDGQGQAHPRRFGLACHLGLLTNIPSIGVAKSRLIGTHEQVPRRKGSWKPLMDNGEVIGVVLRTRTEVKPVYVSVGYGISLKSAVAFVMHCTTRYRLPETTRLAHRLASK